MANSLHRVTVIGEIIGHQAMRAAVLNDHGHMVDDVVLIHWGTWCASHTEAWSPASIFDEPVRDQQHLPRRLEELVIERDDDNPTVATRWAYAADFHQLHRNPYVPAYAFRLVRLEAGVVAEILWKLGTDTDVSPWDQIMDLSTRWPRTGDDEISLAAITPGEHVDGPRLEFSFHGHWVPSNDIRAPYDVVAQYIH